MTSEERRLADREVACVPGGGAGARLYCTAGTLWITRAGDADDHVLAAGGSFPLDRDGCVVVEAVGPAAYRIERASETPSGRFEAVRLGAARLLESGRRARAALLG